MGMLYNAMIAGRIFRRSNTTADVVAVVEMHYQTKHDALPDDQVQMLTASGVKILYLEKPSESSNFMETTLRKFDVLLFDQYSRVLFLDADVMPFCSMDYLFELSDPDPATITAQQQPVLRENLVLGWKIEPANAGFFMLRPSKKFHAELKAIIKRRFDEAATMTGKLQFNRTHGWGHVFEGGDDVWRSLYKVEFREGRSNTEWNWHGEICDQGLLYYWVKYHRKDVSIALGNEIEHWVDRDGRAVLDHRDRDILKQYTCSGTIMNRLRDRSINGASPYADFHHFTGQSKPWLKGEMNETSIQRFASPDTITHSVDLWWHELYQAQQELNFTIGYGVMKRHAAYGAFATTKQLKMSTAKHKHKHENKNNHENPGADAQG